jgi:predicted nucleic acid-binding protein
MPAIIYDTSIYISALRAGNESIFSHRRESASTIWLSAVVLEELYVGSQDGKLTKMLRSLERDFEKINRLVVPLQTDWAICGQILSKIGQKYGFEEVGRSRMTNDCLIAMTAARNGLGIVTKNAVDFRKIHEFRPFNLIEV